MAIKILTLDPDAISKDNFNAHTHNYRKVTRIGVDETKAWTSPTFEDVIDNGDTVAVGLTDIEGAALTTATAKTNKIEKWSGLTGFVGWYTEIEDYGDVWLANGFDTFRHCVGYTNTVVLAASKLAVIAGNAMGIKAIWGVTAGSVELTSTTWVDFRLAVLAAAQWAQDNGVYEFQIGNEELLHNDDDTLTDAQLVINLKAVATEVQAIYTIGNISYSMSWIVDPWIAAGRGNIDLMGTNVYRNISESEEDWHWNISYPTSVFGVDHSYISEFNVWTGYGTEEEAAEGVAEMIAYIKECGITRAIFYAWHDYLPDETFGVVKEDESYKPLWYSLLNSG